MQLWKREIEGATRAFFGALSKDLNKSYLAFSVNFYAYKGYANDLVSCHMVIQYTSLISWIHCPFFCDTQLECIRHLHLTNVINRLIWSWTCLNLHWLGTFRAIGYYLIRLQYQYTWTTDSWCGRNPYIQSTNLFLILPSLVIIVLCFVVCNLLPNGLLRSSLEKTFFLAFLYFFHFNRSFQCRFGSTRELGCYLYVCILHSFFFSDGMVYLNQGFHFCFLLDVSMTIILIDSILFFTLLQSLQRHWGFSQPLESSLSLWFFCSCTSTTNWHQGMLATCNALTNLGKPRRCKVRCLDATHKWMPDSTPRESWQCSRRKALTGPQETSPCCKIK